MKLLSILVASIWAAAAAAQGITIGFPAEGQDVSPGQQLTIEVIKNVRGPFILPLKNLILTSVPDPQDFIQSTTEAGLVIGFTPCPEATFPQGCSPDELGTILFNGPFNPQINGRFFSENFTVTIPSDAPTGDASIAFARFFLSGVSHKFYTYDLYIYKNA